MNINKLKTVDGDVGDIDDLTNERDVLQKKISQQKKLCTEYTKKLTKFEKQFEILSSKYDTYDLDLLYNTSKKYNNLNETKISTDNKILNLLKSIEHNQKHLDGIGSLSFDDNCEHCISNKNTPFAQQSKTLGIEIDSLKEQVDTFFACKLLYFLLISFNNNADDPGGGTADDFNTATLLVKDM